MKRALGIGICLLVPSLVFAAGFAKQSLFLSQKTVTQGETVFIYAVITNDTVNYFNGKLVFSDESGPIGTTTVALDSDRANAYSVSWKPEAGQHKVTARLIDPNGNMVENEDSVFFIDPPSQPVESQTPATTAKPKTTVPGVVDSSAPIVQAVAAVSPYIAEHTVPVFSTIDAARAKAAVSFTRGSDWSKQQITKSATSKSGFMNTLWLILSTMALYVCTAILYVIQNAGVFYPALLALFFFVLWRMYRLVRR